MRNAAKETTIEALKRLPEDGWTHVHTLTMPGMEARFIARDAVRNQLLDKIGVNVRLTETGRRAIGRAT